MSNNMIRVDSNNHWICVDSSNHWVRVDSNNHWICVDSSNHCNSVDSSKICRIAREKRAVGQHCYTGAPASVSPKTPQATCGLSRNLRRSSSALATSREGHRSPRSDLGGQHQGCYADAEPLHSFVGKPRIPMVLPRARPSPAGASCACCERPRGHAADERDKLAPLHRCNHSIPSSARASTIGDSSSPSAFAVLRLMTSSYLEACSTGRSAGLAPFRILSM